MGKKLAIRGHSSRGKEVIKLLEMLGGNTFNSCMKIAYLNRVYYIGNNNAITWDYIGPEEIDKYEIFTLEEFLEKYPFKVGDKVEVCGTNKVFTIGNMIWEDELCTVHYANMEDFEYYTANELKPYKETNMEESKDCPKAPILSNRYDYAEGKYGYVIPAGYEFDCIKEGFQTEIILKPKKSKYPTTFEECLNTLYGKSILKPIVGYKAELLFNLEKLLICRDTYWKILGEEMGLDKPWKPDWSTSEPKYVIARTCNGTEKQWETTYYKTFAFPTEEILDAFYENFKDLIESCKELL